MTLYSFAIATEASGTAGLTNLESLTVPVTPPRPYFRPDTGRVDLGDGSQRALGYPKAEWRWDVLKQTERDQLRTFCTGASAWVYITTATEANLTGIVYRSYHALMIWPEEEAWDATRRMDFVISFRMLTEEVIS